MEKMGSNCEEAEEYFFDSREEMGSVDWDSDCSRNSGSPSVSFGSGMSRSHWNEVWNRELESVSERRSRFMKWIGLSSGQNCEPGGELETECSGTRHLAAERMMYNSGVTLRTSNSNSTMSFVSALSNEGYEAFDDGKNKEKMVIRNLDDGTEFVVDEIDQDGMLCRLHKVGSNFSLSFEEFQRAIGQSPMIRQFLRRCAEEIGPTMEKGKRVKDSWLKKFNLMARRSERGRMADLQPKDVKFPLMQRVHSHKKRLKELSSLFAGQEFMAHKGSIRTMKFSLDGLYLASGGEDGVMCVWKVLADERQDPFNSLASDPSCPYCTLHDTSGGLPHNSEKEKSDSTCTVLPTKVFRVHEKPLHEFRGHNAEILDLSWSKKKLLLSASADSTVRLWQVGSEGCLGVFRHTNYVTSVDFNPMDDNYFISGSLDGKVRIWEAESCRVAGYTDIKGIVTAVSYRPSGKGGLVGSVSGNCLFYTIVGMASYGPSALEVTGWSASNTLSPCFFCFEGAYETFTFRISGY